MKSKQTAWIIYTVTSSHWWQIKIICVNKE